MTLTKDNVVKTTTNERVIRRLLAKGFREVNATQGEKGDTFALFTISQLKQKLDERGVAYKPTSRKAELVELLRKEENDGDKNENL